LCIERTKKWRKFTVFGGDPTEPTSLDFDACE
jgi:hypothetical protein